MKTLKEPGLANVQVATEWLFSVPDHVLEKHLASDPSTPTGEVDAAEDHRVCVPRRVPLQVCHCRQKRGRLSSRFHMSRRWLLREAAIL